MTTVEQLENHASQSTLLSTQEISAAILKASTYTQTPLLVVHGEACDISASRIQWLNHRMAEILQMDESSLINSYLSQIVLNSPQAKEERATHESVLLRTAHGALLEFNAFVMPVADKTYVISFTSAATDSHDPSEEEDERLATVLENSPVATMLSESGVRLAYVNNAMCTLFDTTAEDLLGTKWLRHLGDSADKVIEAVESVFDGEEPEFEITLPHSTIGERLVRVRLTTFSQPGAPLCFIGNFEDITSARRFEEALNYQSRHDSLTGLPNRIRLGEELDKRLENRDDFACYFIDLDRFKEVNDTLGHSAGDALIYALAQRITDCLRPGDLVARWGGDEFIVLCSNIVNDKAAVAAGRRMLTAVSAPVTLHSQVLNPTMSIGVVRANAHSTADSLLRDADVAMYQAKREGKNRVALFDIKQQNAIREDWQLTNDLRSAIIEGSLEVHYQPIVPLYDDAKDSEIFVESLLRWNHPERGFISPAHFCALAEANNMADDIGEYVIKNACIQMRKWLDEDPELAPQKISINMSALQLRSLRPVHFLRNLLDAYDLPAHRISVEVTETSLMENSQIGFDALVALREMGIKVSIDDFGTGHSSLRRLAELPVDGIKIDKSFVDQLSEGQEVIINLIIQMGRAMNLTLIAEGVETEENVRRLRELGCCYAQGWHYAKAMNGNDYITWRKNS